MPTIDRISHGETFVEHPYLGSGLGLLAGVATGIVLRFTGGGFPAPIVAGIVGAIAGAIAGVAIVLVAMSFSAEQAGYGRMMGLSDRDEPSPGYRLVNALYLPVPPVVGAGATLLVSSLLG